MIRFLYALLPNRLTDVVRRQLNLYIQERLIEADIQLSLLQLKGILPPVPPEALRRRIAGEDYGGFFRHGNAFIDSLEAMLRKHGKALADFDPILDFGAGCGRMLIPLSYRIDPARLSGCDIDREAVEWLRTNYPSFSTISCNPYLPPTRFADNQFALIYSISVITHLPEDMQFAWLEELRRITQPNGLVLVSFQKAAKFVLSDEQIMRHVETAGYYYDARSRGHTDGLPGFYQNAYYTHDYIRTQWSRYFDVLEIVDDGIDNQDVALLRKRA